MTIDIEQCPVCGELTYLDGKCYSCGYDDSMQKKFQYNIGITAPAAANGTIAGTYMGSGLTNGDDLPYASEIVFTATGNATNHKQFTTWVITGTCYYKSLTDNPITIQVMGAITITATFATKKLLTINEPTNGTIYKDGVLVTYSTGTNLSYHNVDSAVTLLATPEVDPTNDGMYEFGEWADADNTTTTTLVLTMDDDKEVTPTFLKAYVGYKFIFKVSTTRKLLSEIDEDATTVTSYLINDETKTITVTVTVTI